MENHQTVNDDSSNDGGWIAKVDLSNTGITKMPELKKNLLFITKLNLSCNFLECNIDWLIHLKRLKWLDLSQNKLTKLPGGFGSTHTLEHLDISHNLLKDLPEWVLLIEKVKFISLGFNPLRESAFLRHLNMAKWKNAEICHLENMGLTSIPDCLQNSCSLRELYAGNVQQPPTTSSIIGSSGSNCLWSIQTLPSTLEVIEVAHVSLANLNCNWERMVNLKQLRAQGNEIFWPSDEFTLLEHLEVCDLSSSKIITLPKDVGYLRNLQFLNLAFNQLVVLPKSMEQLEHLSHLDLYSNFISTLECNLSKLPRLVKCDLWKNKVDPLEFLPKHVELCKRLRQDLGIDEKSRCCEQIQEEEPVVAEEDSGAFCLRDFSHSYSDGSDADTSDGLNEYPQAEDDVPPTALASSVDPVPHVEESWDEEAYSDPDLREFQASILPNMASKCNTNEDHVFIPASLHPISCSRPPNEFPVIEGQFDDD